MRWKKMLLAAAAALLALFLILAGSVLCLRWVNPPVTAFTLLEEWEEIGSQRYSLRGEWVPGEELPEHLKWAVIASEDQRFREHRGFDMEAIREALEERREGRRQRGASTISQQVAKNLYLWPAHSLFRKAIEAGITVLIELFWPKERILEVYLNIAEFGPGIFGAGKASSVFFGIPASQLAPEQSARLAAVLPAPKRMRVEPPSPFVEERSRWILRQMTQLSGIRYLPGPVSGEDPEPVMPSLTDPGEELPSESGSEPNGRPEPGSPPSPQGDEVDWDMPELELDTEDPRPVPIDTQSTIHPNDL